MGLMQQMEVWFYTEGNLGREATNATRNFLKKILDRRSSRARQEKSLPLDKDLSWKSANRTFGPVRKASFRICFHPKVCWRAEDTRL